MQFYWNAFQALSGDRLSGLGVGPIPFTALDAYARRFGIKNRDEFSRFMALIGAMDRAYLQWASEQAEGDKPDG